MPTADAGDRQPRVAIRAARPGDTRGILSLWRTAGLRLRTTNEARAIAMRLRGDRALFLVATAGPRIVGTLIAGWDGWRGSMARLAVHPSYRRQGIAERLVARAEAVLHRKGAGRIGALVFADNTLGARFWRAAGYHREKGITRFVKDLER